MAKSKLLAKVTQDYGEYVRLQTELCKEVGAQNMSAGTLAALEKQAATVHAAIEDAKKHFDDLDRRMGPEKSVADRFRNLKNVFKDSKQLAASRQRVKANLDSAQDAFDSTQRTVDMLKQFAQGHHFV